MSWDEYDERQLIGRGKAFRNGFIAYAVLNPVLFFLYDQDLLPIRIGTTLFVYLLLFLPMTIFAISAIHEDAFEGFNKKRSLFLGEGFLSSGAVMIILALYRAANGAALVNSAGYLDGPSSMMFLGLCDLAIGIAWTLHRHKERVEQFEGTAHASGKVPLFEKGEVGRELFVIVGTAALMILLWHFL